LSQSSGLPGDKITVNGTDFTANSDVTIYFDLEEVATDTTDGVGSFTEEITIPEDAVKGAHTIKVVDEEGLEAEDTFTVTEKITIIKPRRPGASPPVYRQGETVSFYVNSTLEFEGNEITLEISDPSGYPFDTLTLIPEPFDSFYIVPYSNATFALPSDAMLGNWNWTATYTMEGEKVEVTGFFTVVVMPYDAMLTKLDEIDAKLVSIDGDVATLSTAIGEVKVSLSDLDAKLVSIDSNVATISTSVGDVKTSLSDLDAKITSLDGDVATISTSVGDVKTSVDSISLKVDSISGDVATLKTDLGTISGKVTSIDGNVATIKTDVGTVKMDISDVKGNFPITVDMTPVWAAVVLSLIAAIAAIGAVVTITRKIAG